MLKLVIGVKGTGKTKALISAANEALKVSKGNVVCIEKGTNLRFDVKYHARLVNTEEYNINDATSLYGLICGILASNSDITDLFIDNGMKICNGYVAAFEAMIEKLAPVTDAANANVFMTASIPAEEASETIKKYC